MLTLLPCYAITGAFAKFCEIMRYALCSFKRYSGYVRYHLITLLREYVRRKCFIFPFSKLLPCYAIAGAFINIILFANVITLLRYYAVTQLTMFFTSGLFSHFLNYCLLTLLWTLY